MMPNKYHNKKIVVNGQKFDSLAEYRRYIVLLNMEQNGEIHNLTCQKPFILFEGRKYISDFYYIQHGHEVIEDVKGFETDVFKIKRDLFMWRYPDIKFLIVKNGRAKEITRKWKSKTQRESCLIG